MSRQDAAAERFRRAQEAALAEAGVAAESRFIEVRKPPMRVHLLEAGAGEPVLMVHGGNSVAASWAPLLPWLAPRMRLLMPDRPGCGLTGGFDYRGVNLRQHGAQFLRGVLDALGLERVALVGNSMGGFFSLAFALQYPQRVSKLVLLGEPAGADGNPRLFHRLVGTRGLNALLYATALRPPHDAEGARAGLAKGRIVAHPEHVPAGLLSCFAAAAQLPGATRSWRTMVEQVFVPAGTGLYAKRTAATHSLMPELGSLAVPTLLLWGDKDPLGTPDVGRMLADRMPHGRLEVVQDASHLVWLDQPAACGEAIVSFLAAQESTGRPTSLHP
ncbi:alpha/beta fold hydrolase [Sinomonas cellulolyticus]|uniref:Alpha/beta hydrolase n=1 Tax=Sinomonas cellulolyticus TaxID=2801916 RepID=A0ABS1K4K5_9MICC|nr:MULTISPECIES: alpha/beta hydrolase [Sinomonas]MBL0706222.1 alpha/beta hydrolase [Sinomonas cellulolyticus]